MRKIRESAAKEQFLGTIILNNPHMDIATGCFQLQRFELFYSALLFFRVDMICMMEFAWQAGPWWRQMRNSWKLLPCQPLT